MSVNDSFGELVPDFSNGVHVVRWFEHSCNDGRGGRSASTIDPTVCMGFCGHFGHTDLGFSRATTEDENAFDTHFLEGRVCETVVVGLGVPGVLQGKELFLQKIKDTGGANSNTIECVVPEKLLPRVEATGADEIGGVVETFCGVCRSGLFKIEFEVFENFSELIATAGSNGF